MTVRKVVPSCPTCQSNSPKELEDPSWPSPSNDVGPTQQMGFTQMPVSQGNKYLLVMIDTFTGWIEGFSTQTEKAEKVVKKLLHEIIPRFGLSRSLQSDNGTSFTSKVTQGVSKSLGITYYLHYLLSPLPGGLNLWEK